MKRLLQLLCLSAVVSSLGFGILSAAESEGPREGTGPDETSSHGSPQEGGLTEGTVTEGRPTGTAVGAPNEGASKEGRMNERGQGPAETIADGSDSAALGGAVAGGFIVPPPKDAINPDNIMGFIGPIPVNSPLHE